MIQMIVADLHSEEYVLTSGSDCVSEQKESFEGSGENGKQAVPQLLRDFLLSDLKMMN